VDLIAGLRINRKGGKSPHQFILLAALNELVKKNIKDFSINEIEAEFGVQWRKAGELNSRAKKNFAMPINGFR
jgi:hypothetical protein